MDSLSGELDVLYQFSEPKSDIHFCPSCTDFLQMINFYYDDNYCAASDVVSQ
jgi:hypothetical protein